MNAVKMSLSDKATKYWGDVGKKDVHGLVLFHDMCEAIRTHRNWTPLAHFYSGAMRAGAQDDVKRLIKAAFGDRLQFDKAAAKKHTSGVAFKMMWADGDIIQFGNQYGHITAAKEQGWGLRHPELHKALKKEVAKPKADPVFENYTKTLAKRLIKDLPKMHQNLSVLVAALEEEIKKAGGIQSAAVGKDGDIAF